MNANFDKLRLRYQRDATQGGVIPALTAVDIALELTSLNFDINQTTIGAGLPFTTEMSFEVRIDPQDKALPATANFSIDTKTVSLKLAEADDFTRFLQDVVFDLNGAPQIEYWDMATGKPLTANAIMNLRHSSVTVQSSTSEGSLATVWLVQLKFLGQIPPAPPTGQNPASAVLFPQLIFPVDEDDNFSGPLVPEIPLPDPDPFLEFFNTELKANFEILLLPGGEASNGGNAIGKVADEIADSFTNLGNTIAGKLSSTINARLQPVAGPVTPDLALWAVIRMGTEAMSFGRYRDFMDAIFCGTPNQSLTGGKTMTDRVKKLGASRYLPFMGVDAYRSIKTATEAFVMVNCMSDLGFSNKDLEDLSARVPLTNGVFDQKSLSGWWQDYRARVNGLDGDSADAIPYLAVIYNKLKDAGIKDTAFEDVFDNYVKTGVTDTGNACFGVIREKLQYPCFLELIWSYWHEESMMVQGLNAIGQRFQNIKGPGAIDPLANLEIDPLRPLSNLLWGYLQDEQHRLTVRRRAYEYDHHYGISLQGTAVRNMRFADSRSKFIEAFHMLLHLTNKFYKQADDMTVQPDGFPILNALKENHLILSEGAHNQYGDLPSVARAEMLMQQWLLARPEFREFLPTRIMVAYPEPWMDRVAALNQMMGWTKTNVLHFRDLGVFGEQLLLSVRFGNWASVNDSRAAANWANFWRPQVQSYIHAYRAVTGVDLTADTPGGRVDALQPSVHLYRRLMEQRGKVA